MADGPVARILVVEDVPENVRLLEAVLTARGYEVACAHDGAEALDLVEAADPDLVLLDVVMPGMGRPGEFTLKGFRRPVPAFNLVAVREPSAVPR